MTEADFVIAMERYEHVERIAGGLREASALRANLRAVRAQERHLWVDSFLNPPEARGPADD